ncbi:MAG TPA: Rid family detoxifying hydrolase [Candidatus Eisenbacteria bacterium]|nr:Rid family detoxifying hydrolase [Candidatus Eisenbacteria bacterium]
MKTPLHVSDAPQAIGPYVQAQVVRLHGGNKLVFTSGQVGLDPASGELVAGGVREQTGRALANLAAVLRGAGLSLGDVVKTTVFLVDMQEFTAMNEVYGRAFGDPPPARTTVAAAALPRGARVEIECVAVGRDL